MIQFSSSKMKPQVRQMWQTVFDDSDEYTDIYFDQKYKDENTLIYFVDDKPIASLQMWEYEFLFYNKIIPVYYLAGLCTYPEHRRKGYMNELMAKAHQVMQERHIPLAILMPAEEWLFMFYEQFGYAQVFDAGGEIIPLQKIVERHDTLEKSFETFNRIYNKTDFTVLKNIEQFKTIVEEQKLTEYEEKKNLDGVARIIDVEYLLKIYAKNNLDRKFTIRVRDDHQLTSNNTYYTIEDGVVSKFPRAIADFEVDIIEICELLMGRHNEEFNARIISKFPKHKPTMNLMLE